MITRLWENLGALRFTLYKLLMYAGCCALISVHPRTGIMQLYSFPSSLPLPVLTCPNRWCGAGLRTPVTEVSCVFLIRKRLFTAYHPYKKRVKTCKHVCDLRKDTAHILVTCHRLLTTVQEIMRSIGRGFFAENKPFRFFFLLANLFLGIKNLTTIFCQIIDISISRFTCLLEWVISG